MEGYFGGASTSETVSALGGISFECGAGGGGRDQGDSGRRKIVCRHSGGVEVFQEPGRNAPRVDRAVAGCGPRSLHGQWLAICSDCLRLVEMDYDGHANKPDLTQLSHAQDLGYEMATALLIDAADGSPLAPMGLSVLCSLGMYSTESKSVQPPVAHLDQVLSWMEHSNSWNLGRRPVFVIDREADSVKHLRAWDAAGHLFLVRADDRRLSFRGSSQLLSEVALTLQHESCFKSYGKFSIRGQMGTQSIAETEVILDQPANGTTADGKSCRIPGVPLNVRLVVVHVRDDDGKLLAEWWLLTNVLDISALQIATWYYWRWRIETFHKLLKSSGLELEEWLQESALAITKRLLVGCMACVTVWALQRQTTPEAETCKSFLVRLSGRQMKRKRPVTAPALMSGLHLLLTMLQVLEFHTVEQLQAYAKIAAPVLRL